MTKCKIKINDWILNKISSSSEISDIEKIHFMKYIGYMTNSERKELSELL